MKTTVLFSGQGETPTADTLRLWTTDAAARSVWDEASEALGLPLLEWAANPVASDTHRAQVVSAIGGFATWRAVYVRLGVVPDFVMGHSVGELAAIALACDLGVSDLARLVDARGRAMQDVLDRGEPTGMTAVLNPPADLYELLTSETEVFIANVNSPSQVVIAGQRAAVDAFVAAHGLRAVPLAVAGAFHTRYLADASTGFRARVGAEPVVHHVGPVVVSNRTATPFRTDDIIGELSEQIVSPVLWNQSAHYAHDHGSQVFLDLSSTGMFTRMLGHLGVQIQPCGTEAAITAAGDTLVDLLATQKAYDLPAIALGAIVTTRNLSANRDDYEQVVIPSYQQLRQLSGTAADAETVVQLVTKALEAKALPASVVESAASKLRWRAALSGSRVG